MTRPLAALAFALAIGAAAPCAGQSPAANATASDLDPETLAIAREVIDLSYPPAGRHALLSRAVDALMAQVRSAAVASGTQPDAGAQAILDRYLDRARAETEHLIAEHVDALFASYARAYARQFTRDELVRIRDFVATPAGARYVQRSADLLADPDVAEANTAYMRSVFDLLQPLQADLRTELTAYFSRRRR